MTFGHAVPRKGLAHEHGAHELAQDILANHEVKLKCDWAPALRSLQEEVKRCMGEPTMMENGCMGLPMQRCI